MEKEVRRRGAVEKKGRVGRKVVGERGRKINRAVL